MPKYLEISAEVVVDLEAFFSAKTKQEDQTTNEKAEVKEEVKDTKD